MYKIGLLSDDKKLGPLGLQQDQIGPVDILLQPDDAESIWGDGGAIRKGAGDVLIISHARVLGRYKSGFQLREKRLRYLAGLGASVQIGKDGEPVTYDEASKIAAFHAAALAPTGQATPKQKRNAGRPSTYKEPQGDARVMALEWWGGKLHTDDVRKLIGQMMATPEPSRGLVIEWFGNRPKCEGRMRKTRSDKKQ